MKLWEQKKLEQFVVCTTLKLNNQSLPVVYCGVSFRICSAASRSFKMITSDNRRNSLPLPTHSQLNISSTSIVYCLLRIHPICSTIYRRQFIFMITLLAPIPLHQLAERGFRFMALNGASRSSRSINIVSSLSVGCGNVNVSTMNWNDLRAAGGVVVQLEFLKKQLQKIAFFDARAQPEIEFLILSQENFLLSR